MSGINPLVWRGLGALGGLLAIIGASVAWIAVTWTDESAGGTYYAEGQVVLAFGIISLLAIGWRHLVGETQEAAPWLDKAMSYLGIASVSRGASCWAWVDRAVALFGIAMLIAVIMKWTDLSGLVGESDGGYSIGAGVYLSLVGSLLLIASSVPSIVEWVKALKDATGDAAGSSVTSSGPGNSAADELEKLAGLLERGVLTQEEFDAKKKELLGL